jgi:tRNA threonylcarbamoyladenosine biosynthesis protein TsaB
MALILHIETAEEICSVCVALDGKVLSLEEDETRHSHASVLPVLIEKSVKGAGMKSLNDLDAVAISMGPGSYTGLRIGTATAKGICYALNKPLISVPTLLSMAESYLNEFSIQENDIIIPSIDARRLEVYFAIYNSKAEEIQPAKAEVINELTFSKWKFSDSILHFIGSGSEKISAFYKNSNFCFKSYIRPQSKGLVNTALKKFKIQKFENTALFEPFYLKDFVSASKR